jgi:hypothetical protein
VAAIGCAFGVAHAADEPDDPLTIGDDVPVSTAHGQITATADSDLASLQSGLLGEVEAFFKLRDLPQPLPQRVQRVNDPAAREELRRTIQRIWEPASADAAFHGMLDEWRVMAGATQMTMISDVRVSLVEWNEVRLDSSDGAVNVTVRIRYQEARTDTWLDEGRVQLYVVTHRDGGQGPWRLRRLATALYLDGQG